MNYTCVFINFDAIVYRLFLSHLARYGLTTDTKDGTLSGSQEVHCTGLKWIAGIVDLLFHNVRFVIIFVQCCVCRCTCWAMSKLKCTVISWLTLVQEWRVFHPL